MAKGIQHYVEAVRTVRPRGGYTAEQVELLRAITAEVARTMPEGYGEPVRERFEVALAGRESASTAKAAPKSPKARAKAAGKARTRKAAAVPAASTVEVAPVRTSGKAGRCPECGRGGGFGHVFCAYCEPAVRLTR